MNVIKTSVSVVCCFAGTALAAGPHWEYDRDSEHGPAHWGELSMDFEACKIGQHQTPIDIRDPVLKSDLPALNFNYTASPLKIINNGHSVQVNLDNGGNLTVGGHTYRLIQFHFHTPSEEQIKGKPSSMVIHLVHKDDAGKLAVVAVLIRKGQENSVLKAVFDNFPLGAGPVHSVEGVSINASDFLPAKHGYYNFEGSLTTPPCSEGVNWFVLSNPIELSAEQIRQFKTLYKFNARPVQPLNGRIVSERAD